MRKILSQEEISSKEKKRNKIIGIVLLFIMVASTAGFAFIYESDNNNGNKNNQGKVQNQGDRWVAQYGDQVLSFSSSPESTNATQGFTFSNLDQYYQKPLYIDSKSEAIYLEIVSNLGRYTERVQYACFADCENSTLVEKNCSDNLIVFRQNDDNKIYQNESCTFIEGDMRAVDAFLYKIFGLS